MFLKRYHQLGLFFDYLNIRDAGNLCIVFGSCKQSKLLSSEQNKHIMNRDHLVELALKQNYWSNDDIAKFFLPYQKHSERLALHVGGRDKKEYFLVNIVLDDMGVLENSSYYRDMKAEDATVIAKRILNSSVDDKWDLLSKIYYDIEIEKEIIDIAIKEGEYDFFEEKFRWLELGDIISILIESNDQKIIDMIRENIRTHHTLNDIVRQDLPYESHEIIVDKIQGIYFTDNVNWENGEHCYLYSKLLTDDQFKKTFDMKYLDLPKVKGLIDDHRFNIEEAISYLGRDMALYLSRDNVEIMSILCEAYKKKYI